MKLLPFQQKIFDLIKSGKLTFFMPRKAGRKTIMEALRESEEIEEPKRIYRHDCTNCGDDCKCMCHSGVIIGSSGKI